MPKKASKASKSVETLKHEVGHLKHDIIVDFNGTAKSGDKNEVSNFWGIQSDLEPKFDTMVSTVPSPA